MKRDELDQVAELCHALQKERLDLDNVALGMCLVLSGARRSMGLLGLPLARFRACLCSRMKSSFVSWEFA